MAWTWPHLVEVDPSPPSSRSPSRSRSRSLQNPVLRQVFQPQSLRGFEAAVRQVSIEDRLATQTVTPVPCCVALEPSTPGPLQSNKKSKAMSEFDKGTQGTAAEEEGLFRTYHQLPTPPGGSGEDIGLEINPHLPPSPLGVDCTVCEPEVNPIDDLPPLPDTPLGIAKFGHLSRESFNTNVRGLVQDEPDIPIGGYVAAPMATPHAMGNIAIRGRGYFDGARGSDALSVPRLEITSPKSSCGPCCDNDIPRRPLLPRSRFSDPFASPVTAIKKDKHIQQRSDPGESGAENSGYSTVMVTALETPVRRDHTNMSHDGPRESLPENVDPHAPLPECCMSPKTDLPEDFVVYDLNGIPRAGSASYVLQPYGVTRAGNVAVPIAGGGVGTNGLLNAGVTEPKTLQAADLGGLALPISDTVIGVPGRNVPTAPGVPAVGIEGNIPTVNGLPTDATGLLPTPDLSGKRIGKRRAAVKKGQTVVRRSRRILLRKPVLALVVGRKLSGPTKEALKLISNGVDVQPDVQGLSEAAGAPASLEGAPVPAPM